MTLIELAVCMAILSIVAAMVAPALLDDLSPEQRETGQEWLDLLWFARQVSIDSNVNVSVVLDPINGEYRIDSSGVWAAGIVDMGQLDMMHMETFQTDYDRLRYFFRPTGAAIGDTARILATDSSVVTWVDPWSGVPHVGNLFLYDARLFPVQ